jgi:hypothetical protein
MTEAKPPEFYFDGIVFNTQYFKDESDIIGFTQDESDARYLRKTVPDTASALQTFSAGLSCSGTLSANIITTNGIGVGTPSAPFSLLTSQTGTLSFGSSTGRTGNINIATTQTTGTGNIVLGSLALTTGSQNIQINRPLTIGYTSNSTFLSQLGGTLSDSSNLQATTTTATSLLTIPNVPAGIYMVYYRLAYAIATGNSHFERREHGITTSQNSFSGILSNLHSIETNHIALLQSPTTNEIIYTDNNSGIIVLTSTSTIYLTHLLLRSQSGTPSVSSVCRLNRIG